MKKRRPVKRFPQTMFINIVLYLKSLESLRRLAENEKGRRSCGASS